MDPLNEVSTGQGRNMRETCARVLAAALMTGAIAGVMGMPALFDGPREADRALTAPPSSLQRSVRIRVAPAPRHPASVERRASAPPRSTPTRHVVVTRALARVAAAPPAAAPTAPPRRRQLASTRPKPKPKPAAPAAAAAPTPLPAAAAPAASAPPAPQAPAPASVDEESDDDDHGHADNGKHNGDDNGNGNGYGHDKHGD
jgi:hypothetical protein